HALAVTLLDLHVHHDGVAGLEVRHLARGALGLDLLDDVVHFSSRLSCKYSFKSSTSSRVLARRVRNRSGRLSHVRPSACFNRQRLMRSWSPLASTSGTLSPANCSGRV